jgi:multidrug efflux pump subunit AcrB
VDLVPEDMSDRILSVTERGLTATVDNIEHIELQSLYGIAVVRVFLQPTANIQQGIAQITAISQTQLRQLPGGRPPPLILADSDRVCTSSSWPSRAKSVRARTKQLWPEFQSKGLGAAT